MQNDNLSREIVTLNGDKRQLISLTILQGKNLQFLADKLEGTDLEELAQFAVQQNALQQQSIMTLGKSYEIAFDVLRTQLAEKILEAQQAYVSGFEDGYREIESMLGMSIKNAGEWIDWARQQVQAQEQA